MNSAPSVRLSDLRTASFRGVSLPAAARPDVVAIAVAMLVALLLAAPNLETNPPLSYDEGYVLEAPHHLNTEGWYGVRIAGRPVPFDTHLSTGPTVLLPVGLALLLLGEGIVQARLVPVMYGALLAAAAYGFVRLGSSRAGALAAALLVAFTLYPYQRTVLGEAPGLFWLVLGGVFWVRGLRSGRGATLAAGGGAVGLAILTKLALGPIAALAFGSAWAAAQIAGRRFPARSLWLPAAWALVPLAAWYILQAVFLGPDELLSRVAGIGAYREQMVGVADLSARWASLGAAVPWGLLPWLAPALLVAVLRAARRGLRSPQITLLPALLLATLLYFLYSIGWSRYAYWFVVLCAVAVGILVPGLLHELRGRTGPAGGRPLRAVAAAAVWLAVLGPQAAWAAGNLGRSDDALLRTAEFVRLRVAPSELAGSTENEVGFVSGVRFLHPPTFVATESQSAIRSGFDWGWPGAEWVVTGSIGEFLGADREVERDGSLIERFRAGPYRVFQRQANETGLPGWAWPTGGATSTGPLSATPVGQTFQSPYGTIDEIRVLLAGEGRTTNAAVELAVYEGPDRGRRVAQVFLDGSTIRENRWYGFPLEGLSLEPGKRYYLELTTRPGPGQSSPQAWFTSMGDHHPGGRWWRGGVAQEGDLYFGLLGYHRFRAAAAAGGGG